nr:hypothetical protein [Pandoravirus massiliensis]
MHSRRLRWPRTPAATEAPRRDRLGAIASACLCVYSGASLMVAALYALCWIVRASVGPTATWHARDRMWDDANAAHPGSGDEFVEDDGSDPWSVRSLWALAACAGGIVWPLWAAARAIARRRRGARPPAS